MTRSTMNEAGPVRELVGPMRLTSAKATVRTLPGSRISALEQRLEVPLPQQIEKLALEEAPAVAMLRQVHTSVAVDLEDNRPVLANGNVPSLAKIASEEFRRLAENHLPERLPVGYPESDELSTGVRMGHVHHLTMSGRPEDHPLDATCGNVDAGGPVADLAALEVVHDRTSPSDLPHRPEHRRALLHPQHMDAEARDGVARDGSDVARSEERRVGK